MLPVWRRQPSTGHLNCLSAASRTLRRRQQQQQPRSKAGWPAVGLHQKTKKKKIT